MAIQPIRGSEITVRFSVNGEAQTGTFEQIEDFSVSPKEELQELDFLGRSTTEFDFQHGGYEFEFTAKVTDAAGLDFMKLLSDNDKSHLPYPSITMIVIHRFRDRGATPPVIHTYKNVVMHSDSMSFGGRKEYATMKFKGMAASRIVSG